MVFFCFFMIFSEIIFFILFFNIELVKNYSYNMWGKQCNFPCKLLWFATVFFLRWFFFCFFIKLSLSILVFWILSWLRIAITSTSFSSQNTMDWYSFSSHGFFPVSFVFFFVIFFSKIIFVDFISFNNELLRI